MIKIIESKFITSAVKPESYPETDLKDFAFVGRSNVGKSSMINTITNRKLLAKIANAPGKTRLINFFEVKYKIENVDATSQISAFGLVDLPGYGYAKVSKTERESWKKMITTFFENRKQLAGVVVLIDIRHDIDPKDTLMINILQEMGINFIVVATKCDKIPKNKIQSHLKKLAGNYYITEFSSLKKIGIENILNWIVSF